MLNFLVSLLISHLNMICAIVYELKQQKGFFVYVFHVNAIHFTTNPVFFENPMKFPEKQLEECTPNDPFDKVVF